MTGRRVKPPRAEGGRAVRAAVPVPVHCVVADLHRSFAVADAACEGRFTHAGVTLDLGRRPDWRTCGLPGDEEWRIELTKLYEGLDLAHAFTCTGELRYLETWQDLVGSFLLAVPVGMDSSDVSARRIQNWIYAAQRFASAEAFVGFDAGFEVELRERIAHDVAHLRGHLTPERNHRTLELYALLVADLAFGDRRAAQDDLEMLSDNAATDVWDDGVHRECSSDYHLIVLRSLVGAIVNARQAGLAVPSSLLERTDLAATFALWLHRPDGSTPALSDGDQGAFRGLLALAADALHRPDLAWVASAGSAGSAPAARAATFPTGGYLFWRSGWASPEERWGVFDCGPIGDGGHGHYDQLSVELFDGPRGLVVDPGRYTYADGPDRWRHRFKGTEAHNTVCVDGLDQIPFRPGRPKGPRSEARLVRRIAGAGIDVATATVRSPCYDAVHTRSVALVGERYWVVQDRLAAPTCHDYAVRWHLDTACHRQVSVRLDDETWVIEGPGVRLLVPRVAGAAIAIEDGWVSRSYGEREPAPVVSIRVGGVSDAEVVTVIGGRGGPTKVAITDTDSGLCLRAGVDGGVDHVRWSEHEAVLRRDRPAGRW